MSVVEFNHQVLEFSHNLKPAAVNLTRDLEDAKDLIQETVYKAITNRDKFKEGTNLKAWMYTIMKNIFINNYRRKKKRNTIMDSTDNLFYINHAAHDVPNDGESQMHVSDLQRAIKKLCIEYKKPFLMHFEGFKYEEIAKQLDLPIGTVKSRIHLARKDLKRMLRHYQRYTN